MYLHRKTAGYTCEQITKQTTEFIENRLPAATNSLVWRHLGACADCSTYVQQLALVRDSLRKWPEPVMSHEMRAKLLKHLGRMAGGSGDS